MEVHQIRYVLAVHEARSFTKAAKRCGVSQPALSAAVKKLEEEFGGVLFYRESSGVTLTALGELLLPRIARAAEELSTIDNLAKRYHLLEQAALKIGVLKTIGPRWIAPILNQFREQAPRVDVEIHTASPSGLFKMLEDGSVELALGSEIATAAPPEWLVSRDLVEEPYVVLLPPGHPLAQEAQIDLKSLDGERYIDRLGCEMRERVEGVCRENGVTLYASYRTEHDHWIESFVHAGIGFAFLPERTVFDKRLSRPLVRPKLKRVVRVFRHADRPRSPAGRCLWETIVAPPA